MADLAIFMQNKFQVKNRAFRNSVRPFLMHGMKKRGGVSDEL